MKIWYRVTITFTMLLVIFALLITGFQLAVYGDSHYGFYKKEYEKYRTDKYPARKTAVLACMDTRLTELLPAALGVRNGDIKLIKNAGAIVTHPYGSVIHSLIIAIYELGVEEIWVIGHDDCGMQNVDTDDIIEKMKQHGITVAYLHPG